MQVWSQGTVVVNKGLVSGVMFKVEGKVSIEGAEVMISEIKIREGGQMVIGENTLISDSEIEGREPEVVKIQNGTRIIGSMIQIAGGKQVILN